MLFDKQNLYTTIYVQLHVSKFLPVMLYIWNIYKFGIKEDSLIGLFIVSVVLLLI